MELLHVSDRVLAMILSGWVSVGALDGFISVARTLLCKTSSKMGRGGGSGGTGSFKQSSSCL